MDGERDGRSYKMHVYRVALVTVTRLNKTQHHFSGWFHFYLTFYRNSCLVANQFFKNQSSCFPNSSPNKLHDIAVFTLHV